MPTALVRRPSPRLAEGELTFFERTPLDYELALQQWQGYVAALAAAGFDCVEVPPSDEYPDGVFVEDTVVMVGPVAVLARAGAHSRAGELESVRASLAALGIPVQEITAPGHLDGGDVLKVGTTIYVGRSTRTDDDGVAQFTALAEAQGFTVVPISVTRALHLKSTLTALPDGTIIGYAPLIDDVSLFGAFVAVPEPQGNAVVVLGPDRVLMSASAPQTAALLTARGLDVVTVPITELEKAEGCVTCLSVRIR